MNATTTAAPAFATTIDQHEGDHAATGLRITKLTDVRTGYSDYSQEPWGSLSAEDKAWWTTTLEAIHAAQVELAGLDADHRTRAEEYLADNGCDSADDVPATIRAAIEATA